MRGIAYKLHTPRLLTHLHQLIIAIVLHPIRDILLNGPRKQYGLLPHKSNLLSYALYADVLGSGIIEIDVADLGFVEALDELDDGGFARTALTHEGDVLAFFYVEVQAFKDLGVALGVAESHVYELDLAF